MIVLEQAPNALKVGLKHIIHFKLVAKLCSELLPWLPAVIDQNDLFHELIYSFCGSWHNFLICVFGLGDSSDNLDKLISHQDARIHPRDRHCSIVDSVELDIDLPGKESPLAFFVRNLNLVAEG